MFSKEISCGFLEVDKEEKQAFTCHYLKGKKKKKVKFIVINQRK